MTKLFNLIWIGIMMLAGVAALTFSNGTRASYSGEIHFGDNFDDGERDTVMWNLGVLSSPSSSLDLKVTAAEVNGHLSITPRVAMSRDHYNGYVSVSILDLTGASSRIEVVKKATGGTNTIFSIGIDSNNWYRFRTLRNKLYLEKKVRGTSSSTSITYDEVQQRFWRFRHDKTADTIAFETSVDGNAWMSRRTISRDLTITSMRVELAAGTSKSESAPGVAQFDSFVLELNSSNSTPSPTPTPVPPIPTATPEPMGSYYVSPDGSDSNPGTADLPFATIRKAAKMVSAGNTVVVRDGVYTGWETCSGTRAALCLGRGGTAAGYVTFRAENPRGAVIDGQNQANEGVYPVAGVSYVRLEGFEIINIAATELDGGASGIALYSGGDFFTLRNLLIRDIGRICTDTPKGQNGLFIQRRNVTVENVEVRDVGRFAPGEMGCRPATANYQNHDHGFYINGSSSGAPGAADVTLSRVSVSNVPRGWAVQIYPGTVSRLRITNSTFTGANPYRDGQILLGANTADCLFDAITFDHPRTVALRFYQGAHVGMIVSNNVVYGAGLADVRPAGVTFTNNSEF